MQTGGVEDLWTYSLLFLKPNGDEAEQRQFLEYRLAHRAAFRTWAEIFRFRIIGMNVMIDADRYRVSSATASTCTVCGNIGGLVVV